MVSGSVSGRVDASGTASWDIDTGFGHSDFFVTVGLLGAFVGAPIVFGTAPFEEGSWTAHVFTSGAELPLGWFHLRVLNPAEGVANAIWFAVEVRKVETQATVSTSPTTTLTSPTTKTVDTMTIMDFPQPTFTDAAALPGVDLAAPSLTQVAEVRPTVITPGARRRREKETKAVPLSEVSGVGKRRAKKLAEAGIEDAAALGRTSAKRVAEVLDVDRAAAAELIAAAKEATAKA